MAGIKITPPIGPPIELNPTSGGGKGPLRGERLEFLLPINGKDLRCWMKESVGTWLELTPQYPEYGTFNGKGGDKNCSNKGARYTKRAGFRFQSFGVLLKPGTVIKEPKLGGGSTDRTPKMVWIGFARGKGETKVTVSKVIEFLKDCKRKDNIMGVVTPSGAKHQWRGRMSETKSPVGGGLVKGIETGVTNILEQVGEVLLGN